MEKYIENSELRARDAARALANAVNEIGFDAKAFADELCQQHRTLQQNAFRAVGAFLLELAADHYGSDLRNEHASVTAARIVAEFGDRLRYVPFI